MKKIVTKTHWYFYRWLLMNFLSLNMATTAFDRKTATVIPINKGLRWNRSHSNHEKPSQRSFHAQVIATDFLILFGQLTSEN